MLLGIGLMIARALALNGARKVYIIGRRKDALEAAASSVTTNNIIPMVGDVTSKDSLKTIVSQITVDIGYVNVVIANSGIAGPQNSFTPETSLQDFQKSLWDTNIKDHVQTFEVNVTAAWYTIVAFLDLLDKGNKKGNVPYKSQVIATSSIGGFNRMAPGGFAYGQSKAGATHMMKQLATALVPYEIRSNVICPGLYPSDMSAPILAKNTGKSIPKSSIPAERVGTEEDMAGAILYLTSMAGGYCNGNVIITDGGRLSVMPATY